jgi:hypothetical protein
MPSIFETSRSTQLRPDDPVFATPTLNFAAAIIAEDILVFVCVRAVPGRGSEFVFDDPHGIGNSLLRKFKSGLFPKVNPTVYCEAREFLINATKGKR